MSAPDETVEEVTEDEFVEAFLKVLQGAFRFALKDRYVRLYEAVVERQDDVMFTLLEELDLAYSQDFTKMAFAHQNAFDSGGDLPVAITVAAAESAVLAVICEDLAKVRQYCSQVGVESTSFTMEYLMGRSVVQPPGGRLLRQ